MRRVLVQALHHPAATISLLVRQEAINVTSTVGSFSPTTSIFFATTGSSTSLPSTSGASSGALPSASPSISASSSTSTSFPSTPGASSEALTSESLSSASISASSSSAVSSASVPSTSTSIPSSFATSLSPPPTTSPSVTGSVSRTPTTSPTLPMSTIPPPASSASVTPNPTTSFTPPPGSLSSSSTISSTSSTTPPGASPSSASFPTSATTSKSTTSNSATSTTTTSPLSTEPVTISTATSPIDSTTSTTTTSSSSAESMTTSNTISPTDSTSGSTSSTTSNIDTSSRVIIPTTPSATTFSTSTSDIILSSSSITPSFSSPDATSISMTSPARADPQPTSRFTSAPTSFTTFTTLTTTSTRPGGGVTTITTILGPSGSLSPNDGKRIGPRSFFQNAGAVVGVVTAVLLALSFIAFWLFFAFRRHRRRQFLDSLAVLPDPTARPPLEDDDLEFGRHNSINVAQNRQLTLSDMPGFTGSGGRDPFVGDDDSWTHINASRSDHAHRRAVSSSHGQAASVDAATAYVQARRASFQRSGDIQELLFAAGMWHPSPEPPRSPSAVSFTDPHGGDGGTVASSTLSQSRRVSVRAGIPPSAWLGGKDVEEARGRAMGSQESLSPQGHGGVPQVHGMAEFGVMSTQSLSSNGHSTVLVASASEPVELASGPLGKRNIRPGSRGNTDPRPHSRENTDTTRPGSRGNMDTRPGSRGDSSGSHGDSEETVHSVQNGFWRGPFWQSRSRNKRPKSEQSRRTEASGIGVGLASGSGTSVKPPTPPPVRQDSFSVAVLPAPSPAFDVLTHEGSWVSQVHPHALRRNADYLSPPRSPHDDLRRPSSLLRPPPPGSLGLRPEFPTREPATLPSFAESPVLAPEGLLDPGLRHRLQGQASASSIGLQDHEDYSRPIRGTVKNRQESVTTVSSVYSQFSGQTETPHPMSPFLDQ